MEQTVSIGKDILDPQAYRRQKLNESTGARHAKAAAKGATARSVRRVGLSWLDLNQRHPMVCMVQGGEPDRDQPPRSVCARLHLRDAQKDWRLTTACSEMAPKGFVQIQWRAVDHNTDGSVVQALVYQRR